MIGHITSRIVDNAIRLYDGGRKQEAIELLNTNNVPVEVAIRVLTRPELRRNKIFGKKYHQH